MQAPDRPYQQTHAELGSLRDQVRISLDQCRNELLDHRNDADHWEGELSASALSTATAISAMAAVICAGQASENQLAEPWLQDRITAGIDYLRTQQNDDGGFGDTNRSHSNIATSYLVLAATHLAQQSTGESLSSDSIKRLEAYIDRTGNLDGLRARYGKDKTFVVPIMCNMAIAGLVDWNDVPALPFEAAAFPQSWYRFLRMPVVSYAVPALVAIGQARHFLGRRAFMPLRWMRSATVQRTLSVLRRMQPESGGYLEATPLTSFVVMSLAATGRIENEVVSEGLRFLRESMREDGSWPIDTNLATWVTSLSIHAFACDPEDDGTWCTDSLVRWHLGCQHHVRHPFTGAEPGGWGWTDLSGAVPDGDDTPAALLAINQFRKRSDGKYRTQIEEARSAAKRWLAQLQNRDGGWPTFCRGWGKLPFDRSSTDLSAHAIRALGADMTERQKRKVMRFLRRQQQSDGSWLPLWFGNQDRPDESNPIYGTSRVLLASGIDDESQRRAVQFLIANQNPDGGWGGGSSVNSKLASGGCSCRIPSDLVSSVEETALAVDALTTIILKQRDFDDPSMVKSAHSASESSRAGETLAGSVNRDLSAAIIGGVRFLLDSVEDERHRIAWPIGFYFAKLWYHERLYPLVFTATAFGKYLRATQDNHDLDWPR